MEDRKHVVIISLLGFLAGFIFLPKTTLAYGAEVHATLTKSIFGFYNQNYSNPPIPADLLPYLIDGSRREDDTPRWMNHFYDPVFNRGLIQDLAIDTTVIPGRWSSSKNWAQTPSTQNSVIYKTSETIASALTALETGKISNLTSETDFTWQKAISLYAAGDKEGAMFALGHILHLIEDMTVPAHTRNDPHPEGDPYELYADQFGAPGSDSDLNKRLSGKKPIILSSLDDYFNNLASFTNKNFFSKDTIGLQSGYNLPEIPVDNLQSNNGSNVPLTEASDSDGELVRLVKRVSGNGLILANRGDFTVNDPAVNSSYWNILSTKSVQYGAGVINLFFQEAKAAENNNGVSSRPDGGKSFIASALDAFLKFSQAAKTAARSALAEIFGGNVRSDGLVETIDLGNKGGSNMSVKASASVSQPTMPPPRLSITEVMYNPPGSDSNQEWVEVLNTGNSAVDLAELKFQTNGVSHRLTGQDNGNKLKPGGYGVIANNFESFKSNYPAYRGLIWTASFSLNNDGGELSLLTDDATVSKVNYDAGKGANGDGNSLQFVNGQWLAFSPTPGEPNRPIQKIETQKPDASLETNLPTGEKNLGMVEENQASSQSTSSVNRQQIISPPAPATSCSFKTNQAPGRTALIINEVAWMGDTRSANDEWLELKNISDKNIDLAGWRILSETGKIDVSLGGKISPGGYFLLERTDDGSAVGVKADLIYSGALANNGVSLRLFDDNCGLADEILSASGWPAGDNSAKRTMERDDSDFGWHTSTAVGGTPRAPNDQAFVQLSGSGGGGGGGANNHDNQNNGENSNNDADSTSSLSYPRILITEIQLASASSTKDEFAEIYNPNGESVDLTGWYVEKKTKSAADFSTFAKTDLFSGRSIAPNGFLVIANPEGGIGPDVPSTYGLAANNTLVIKNPNREIVDKVGWGEAGDYESGPAANPPDGQSIGRKISAGLFADTDDNRADFEISSCPSPGKISGLCDSSESTSTEADSATSTVFASSTLTASADYDPSARIISLSWNWDVASSSLADDASFAVKLASEEATSSENIVWADAALEATTTQKNFDLPITEVGRSYYFLVEALDASSSEIISATTSIFAAGLINNLYFYASPKEPSVALADIYSSKEIGALADLLVFYLNQEPPGVSEIISEGNLSNFSQLGGLSIKYQPCSSLNPTNAYYFSTAPILVIGRGNCATGPTNTDLSPDQLEDGNHLRLSLAASPADLSLDDNSYLTASYYGITPVGPWGPRTFQLLADDDTKYYFRDYSPEEIDGFNQPPTRPADFSAAAYQDGLNPYFLFNWTRSTDPDSLDGLITYRLSLSPTASSTSLSDNVSLGTLKTGDALDPQKAVAAGESYEVFLNHNNTDPINNFPKFYPALSGEYLASLVACDEFDNCSEAATTTLKSVVSSIIASAAEGSNPVPLRTNDYWGKIAQKFSVPRDTQPTDLTIVLSTCAPLSCSGMNPIGAKISLKSSLTDDPLYAETVPAESVFKMELSDSDRAAGKISLSLPENLILTTGDYYLLIEPDPPAGQALWEMRSYEGSGYDAGSLYVFDGSNWQVIPDKDLYFELRGIEI